MKSNMFYSTIFATFAFVCLAQASPQDENQVVNGSNYWVVKIAEEACKPGAHDDVSTAKIFRCYFEIPKTETFLGCQYKTFGHFLNNERNMDDFCARWNETFVYYACNQKAFADEGLSSELPAVVEKLNLCQAKVLKLGQFADSASGQRPAQRPPMPLAQLWNLLQGTLGAALGMHDQPAAGAPPPGRK